MAEPGTLYTIPFSHYCELARWSLQVAKIPFVEYPYLPGIHMFFSPVERIRRRAEEAGTGKGSGTPLYVAASGEVLGDSWQVLQLAGLGSVPEDVFQTLNYGVGPAIRAIVYADALRNDRDHTLKKFGADSPVSWWQHFLWSLGGFRRTVAGKMWEQMVGDEERQAKTLQDFEEALTKLDAELAKPTSCFKGSKPDELTASALALAALLAPAVCPPNYTGNLMSPPQYEDFSEPHQQRMKAWRERPIGKFVLDVYRLHRESVLQSA
mmetsp:Transcript_47048/g.87970  ORF Transcript_47048/g.87970 Transcript_47048/m.87970 type:complete len:266 (+) Transcript_47048:62-859(+)